MVSLSLRTYTYWECTKYWPNPKKLWLLTQILWIKDKLYHFAPDFQFVPGYPSGSMWDKVFKNGPSKMCGRQGFKNLKWYGLLTYHLKCFKGCLPQILLGLFLNTLPHMQLHYGLIFNISLFRQVLNQKTKLNLGKWWWKTECLYTCWSGSGAWELGSVGKQVPQRVRAEPRRRLWRSVKKCERIAFCDSY